MLPPDSHGSSQLCARNLSYAVRGTRLINSIDLNLSADELTIILGQNGAGKSLLLRLMHGLIKPDTGEIRWNDQLLSTETRKRQAMVFQKPVLLRRTVAANLDFVLRLRGNLSADNRQRLLDLVSLSDAANQPARSLSGGEQQRLSLACALANGPEVIFLDEPTASLDPASVLLIEQIVSDEQRQGTKVVFVTHDLGQARRLGGEVVFLHQGKLEEQSSSQNFFEQPASPIAKEYLAGKLTV